jgi:riboflavin biosynthesis pyrimidine reductase
VRLEFAAALVMTHALRVCHQALLVGVETILADDPRLNVRYVAGEDPRPVILVKAIAARMEVPLVNLRYQPLGGDMIVFGRVAYRPWKL